MCVSSQVGCSRDCTFCATGTLGLLHQLSSAEILEQLWHAHVVLSLTGTRPTNHQCESIGDSRKIRNVVFMGMGEPLDNYKAVLGALR